VTGGEAAAEDHDPPAVELAVEGPQVDVGRMGHRVGRHRQGVREPRGQGPAGGVGRHHDVVGDQFGPVAQDDGAGVRPGIEAPGTGGHDVLVEIRLVDQVPAVGPEGGGVGQLVAPSARAPEAVALRPADEPVGVTARVVDPGRAQVLDLQAGEALVPGPQPPAHGIHHHEPVPDPGVGGSQLQRRRQPVGAGTHHDDPHPGPAGR
jgi:hypothetical protein